MLTRKLGKLLRGNATSFQIVAACGLGALTGFAPGLARAPALMLLWIALLLLLNANLGLALLMAGVGRLLALVLAPVSFQIGRVLLDGPTSGLAHAIVNSPVLAWCGLDYYAVAGGQVIALGLGALTGLGLARAIGGFRRRMLAAQEQPSRMQELAARPWARFAIWLFFGGQAKGTWEEKLARRVGNPVRIWGAALILLFLVGSYLGQRALAGPLAQRGLRIGLEQANGATVDVDGVELALGEGRVAVSGLALADPNALDRDLFAAGRLELDVDQADFLRRRFHVARVVVSEARSGFERAHPGELLAPRPAPAADEAEPPPPGAPDVRDFSLEDVLQDVEVWKARLAQARQWLDRLSGPPGAEGEGEGEESLAERLARRAEEGGWLSVRAGHLLDQAPTFRLSELVVDGLEASFLPGLVLDLHAQELSTNPALVDAPPRVELASRDGTVRLEVDLAPVSRGGGDGALRFAWKGLQVDRALAGLRLEDGPPFRGGTLDLEIDGAWDQGRIGHVDLPLRVTLRDTTMSLPGVEPTHLDELVLPIGIAGPIDGPRVRFDPSALRDALVAAGKREIAERVTGALEGEVGEKLEELKEKTGVELPGGVQEKLPDGAKGALEGLFGGKKKDG